MIQCEQCEFFRRGPDGQVAFRCDPFSTIKEPECLAKWQLLKLGEMSQRLDRLAASYEATLEMHRRMQPLQEKMFRHIEREIRDQEEDDAWKRAYEDDPDADEDLR